VNLIYIFADQWRRDAVGIYNKEVITPNIDTLAKDGFVFNRAYSTSPVCSPHRACLLTGKFPIQNGVFTNCKPGIDAQLSEDDICVSDVLKENNYETGYIGKWHLDKPDGGDSWDAYTPPGKRRHGFDFWYSYGADDNHNTPHYWNTEGKRIDINQWSVEHETDVALRFLQNTKGKFALFISYNPPHSPYDSAPYKYKKLYDDITLKENVIPKFMHHTGEMDKNLISNNLEDTIREYYGAVSGVDDNIGRIVGYLKDNNLYDDTMIVISSDHGDMLGSHGLMGKYVWHEESIGIPLIFSGGRIGPNQSNELIGSTDHAPTLLGMLGISVPEDMQGKDFSPLIRGERFEGYKSIITEGFPNSTERIKSFEENGENFLDYGWRCVVTQDYKLAIHRGYSFGEEKQVFLYDIKNYPLENKTIEDTKKLEELKQEMRYWLELTSDGFKV
jgi:arylsulfatase A-like enzyme